MKMEQIDNIGDNTLANLLKREIRSNSEISVASANFSIFAYNALRKELGNAQKFKFIFTEPTFYRKETDLKRQYKILGKEGAHYPNFEGNDFEIQLRNKMMSKSIANSIVDWINSKAMFKTLTDTKVFPKEIIIDNQEQGQNVFIQSEVNFTADGLGVTQSDRLASFPAFLGSNDLIKNSLEEFNSLWNDGERTKDVTKEVLNQLSLIYKENSPEWLYFVTLYNIFSDDLESISEENIIKEGTNFKDTVIWNKLYSFQKDGVMGLIDKIEKYNGCILADSVGLGKTFSALAVIKYYELRNDRVLVLAPKKLRDNWSVYTQNDKRNILSKDRFNYDVLNHTDLSRDSGYSGEMRLDTINWSNYDLVVIDESHNFRNNNARKNHLTRYQKLMQDIIQKGVKTKVLMLSATPVNNRMNDIKNQIAFITEDNENALESSGIESIDEVLRQAQTSFNFWLKLPSKDRTTEQFLEMVTPEYFHLLDLLSIARSRKHLEKYYDIEEIGEFPERLKPISIKSDIDTENDFMKMEEVNQTLGMLLFSMYQPMKYILPTKRKIYEELYDTKVKEGLGTFKQSDREKAIASLMKINMFKRLESSIASFNLTLEKLVYRIEQTMALLKQNDTNFNENYNEVNDFEDPDFESITVGSEKVKININDIDKAKWLGDLEIDLEILKDLLDSTKKITVKRDAKIERLKNQIFKKISNPINSNNKKIIIFSAFADTVKYLYDNLSPKLEDIGLHSAMVVGSGANKTTMKGVKATDLNDILLNFSPVSKERDKILKDANEEIDIIFATDCISEGQNLQDCDYLINYDIHWNPVRIIQRFGRIDRIGSHNKQIQLVNFWPNMDLDEYINLEDRVKGRMKLLNTSATGEEDIFDTSGKEMNDIEYRKNQLKNLQERVIDLEDVEGAISITDLTFTEFKSDLREALKLHGKDLKKAPKGMYALVSGELLNEVKDGVIFCFKQNSELEMKNNNLVPYILLYLDKSGEITLNYANAKKILDIYRKLTLGKNEPIGNLVEMFNDETNEGEDMMLYTDLLKQSIDIVKDKHDDSVFESFFDIGGTNVQQGLSLDFDDLELISFLIIKEAR